MTPEHWCYENPTFSYVTHSSFASEREWNRKRCGSCLPNWSSNLASKVAHFTPLVLNDSKNHRMILRPFPSVKCAHQRKTIIAFSIVQTYDLISTFSYMKLAVHQITVPFGLTLRCACIDIPLTCHLPVRCLNSLVCFCNCFFVFFFFFSF